MKEYLATLDEAAWGRRADVHAPTTSPKIRRKMSLSRTAPSRPNRSCALILDGTVVRIRLDRKATAISLLVVGVRRRRAAEIEPSSIEGKTMQPITEQRKVEGDRLIGNREGTMNYILVVLGQGLALARYRGAAYLAVRSWAACITQYGRI